MGTSTYTDEVAAIICERIALGESLRRICVEDDMPSQSTVFKWLEETPSFSEQYGRARARQAEGMIDEILEIADDSTQDTAYGDSGPKPNSEWISRSKLRVDARLKLMAQLNPKKYGAKMAVSGADGAPLVPPADLSNLSAEDLRTMLALRRKMRPQEGQADGA